MIFFLSSLKQYCRQQSRVCDDKKPLMFVCSSVVATDDIFRSLQESPTLPYPALLSNDRLTNSHGRHGPKSGGGAAVPLSVEGAGFPSNTMSPWAEAYLRNKCHRDPSRRFVTIGMSRGLRTQAIGETGGLHCPFAWGSWVPI